MNGSQFFIFHPHGFLFRDHSGGVPNNMRGLLTDLEDCNKVLDDIEQGVKHGDHVRDAQLRLRRIGG